MTEITAKKVRELLEDEAFGKKVENLETVEELKEAFKAQGVELTAEEVYDICEAVTAPKDGEISADQLDQISGGSVLAGALIIAGGLALSYGAGYVAGKIIKKKSGTCM